jgi:probable F420-dependent oxidoreductase
MRTDYEESGIPYDEPAVRVDRFEEAVAVYKQLFRDGTATFEGKHYSIAGAVGEPRPPGGGPTLLIGGGGKRVLSHAAREADIIGVNPNLKSGATDQATAQSAVADMVDKRIGWIREAAGERFDDLDLQMLTFIVAIGGDRDEMAKLMAPSMGLTEEQAKHAPLALVGSVDEIGDQLVERRERWGLNDWVVHDPELEAFAEIVARLAGT